jgi:hypothetical protein
VPDGFAVDRATVAVEYGIRARARARARASRICGIITQRH